jgi:hypothetical protein
MDGSSQPRLDMILQLLDEAVFNAAKYMACPDCDAGCPRLMNLALLHQRQVNTLCEVAKSPATFLCDENCVVLGGYRSCREDGLAFKRLVLLRIVKNVIKSIEEFQERATDFQSRFLAGTLELGDAGKLNLKWLLDIGSNLARRLGCIRSILEKEDWTSEI